MLYLGVISEIWQIVRHLNFQLSKILGHKSRILNKLYLLWIYPYRDFK